MHSHEPQRPEKPRLRVGSVLQVDQIRAKRDAGELDEQAARAALTKNKAELQRLESKHKQNDQLYALQRRELDLREIRLKAENEKAAELADQRWAEAMHTVATTAGVVEEIKVKVAKRRRRKLACGLAAVAALAVGLWVVVQPESNAPTYAASQLTLSFSAPSDRRRHAEALPPDSAESIAIAAKAREILVTNTPLFDSSIASVDVFRGSTNPRVDESENDENPEARDRRDDDVYTAVATTTPEGSVSAEAIAEIADDLTATLNTTAIEIDLGDGRILRADPVVSGDTVTLTLPPPPAAAPGAVVRAAQLQRPARRAPVRCKGVRRGGLEHRRRLLQSKGYGRVRVGSGGGDAP